MSSDEKWGVGDQEESKSFATTVIGDRPYVGDGDDRGGGFEVELIHGQYPHSRSDQSIYARFPSGEVQPFDGHRLLHRIEFVDFNYLKESELSSDEVRKGGTCRIWINGFCCHEFFYREVEEAMLRARGLLSSLHEHPISIWDEGVRNGLVGRKIYWHDFPAVIDGLTGDGCVMVVPDKVYDDGSKAVHFPPRPYELEDASRGEGEVELSGREKVELNSSHIWWWRERE